MDHNEQERIEAAKRAAAKQPIRYENRRPYIIIALITGIAFYILFLAKEPGAALIEKIGLAITISWIFFNGLTYRGRYRPRIVYAVKICYPLFLFLLIMAAFGRL